MLIKHVENIQNNTNLPNPLTKLLTIEKYELIKIKPTNHFSNLNKVSALKWLKDNQFEELNDSIKSNHFAGLELQFLSQEEKMILVKKDKILNFNKLLARENSSF